MHSLTRFPGQNFKALIVWETWIRLSLSSGKGQNSWVLWSIMFHYRHPASVVVLWFYVARETRQPCRALWEVDSKRATRAFKMRVSCIDAEERFLCHIATRLPLPHWLQTCSCVDLDGSKSQNMSKGMQMACADYNKIYLWVWCH